MNLEVGSYLVSSAWVTVIFGLSTYGAMCYFHLHNDKMNAKFHTFALRKGPESYLETRIPQTWG